MEDEGGTIRGGRSRFKCEIPVTGGPGLAKWTSTSSEPQHLELTPGVILVPSCLQEFPSLVKSSSQIGYTANSSCQLMDKISMCKRFIIQPAPTARCNSSRQIFAFLFHQLANELSGNTRSRSSAARKRPQEHLHCGGFTFLPIYLPSVHFLPISSLNLFPIRFSPFFLVPILSFSLTSSQSLGPFPPRALPDAYGLHNLLGANIVFLGQCNPRATKPCALPQLNN